VGFTRWDPTRDLLALHEHIGQLVGSDAPGWAPLVDLYETEEAFVLTAELPGLTQDQVDINAEESRVVIRGERVGGGGPGEAHYHLVERGHGRFARSFVLPESIDVARVTADLSQGLLTVTMPKAGARGPRRIEVS